VLPCQENGRTIYGEGFPTGKANISPRCGSPPAGATRGLYVSPGNILEDLLFQEEVGYEPAHAGILPFKVLQALGLLDLQAA
jgi:hypothetical protein